MPLCTHTTVIYSIHEFHYHLRFAKSDNYLISHKSSSLLSSLIWCTFIQTYWNLIKTSELPNMLVKLSDYVHNYIFKRKVSFVFWFHDRSRALFRSLTSSKRTFEKMRKMSVRCHNFATPGVSFRNIISKQQGLAGSYSWRVRFSDLGSL